MCYKYMPLRYGRTFLSCSAQKKDYNEVAPCERPVQKKTMVWRRLGDNELRQRDYDTASCRNNVLVDSFPNVPHELPLVGPPKILPMIGNDPLALTQPKEAITTRLTRVSRLEYQ